MAAALFGNRTEHAAQSGVGALRVLKGADLVVGPVRDVERFADLAEKGEFFGQGRARQIRVDFLQLLENGRRLFGRLALERADQLKLLLADDRVREGVLELSHRAFDNPHFFHIVRAGMHRADGLLGLIAEGAQALFDCRERGLGILGIPAVGNVLGKPRAGALQKAERLDEICDVVSQDGRRVRVGADCGDHRVLHLIGKVLDERFAPDGVLDVTDGFPDDFQHMAGLGEIPVLGSLDLVFCGKDGGARAAARKRRESVLDGLFHPRVVLFGKDGDLPGGSAFGCLWRAVEGERVVRRADQGVGRQGHRRERDLGNARR